MGWGEAFLDHLEKHFTAPCAAQTFSPTGRAAIQVLELDRVFEGCRVFATFGASHYAAAIGGPAEIIVPVDDGWQMVPALLAGAVFAMADTNRALTRGVALAGLTRVDPQFATLFDKEALYFTRPYGLPEGFSEVCFEGQHGFIHLGIFLSAAEYEALERMGAEAFETALEASLLDPFALKRSGALEVAPRRPTRD